MNNLEFIELVHGWSDGIKMIINVKDYRYANDDNDKFKELLNNVLVDMKNASVWENSAMSGAYYKRVMDEAADVANFVMSGDVARIHMEELRNESKTREVDDKHTKVSRAVDKSEEANGEVKDIH
jgi:hypothetical protein